MSLTDCGNDKEQTIISKSKNSLSPERDRLPLTRCCSGKHRVRLVKAAADKTEKAITSKEYKELKLYRNVKNFQKVCVVADPVFFSNQIMNDEFCLNSEIHFINISALEDLLEMQKTRQNMFYLLRDKMKKDEDKIMDFKEYLIKKAGGKNIEMKYLMDYFYDYVRNTLGVKNFRRHFHP